MKTVLVLIAIVVFGWPKVAFATSKIDIGISGNGPNSNNSVSVENNTGGQSINGQSSSTSQTDIRIETNGEVKEYHSNNGGEVSIQSSDGKSSVRVSNPTSSPTGSSNINTQIETTTESTGSSIPTAPPTPTLPPMPNTRDLDEKKFDLIKFLQKELEALKELPANLLKNLFR